MIKIDGHPVPEVEGDGNCGECLFNGQALDLDIAPRDLVSVEWSEDSRATWRRRYTGIAVQSGSPQNTGTSGYKLVGLMKKLEEAETRAPLAKGDLGGQVQTLITNTLATGQWGNLIDPLIVRQDVPAVTSGAIIPNFQPVSVILKEKLCPRLLKSRVAINANRQVVFGVPSGTLLIDEATEGVLVEWQDIGSEELVTDVRFEWVTGMNGVFTIARPDVNFGFGLQIDAGSPPLFTRLLHTTDMPTDGSDPWPYGHSTRTQGMTLDSGDFDLGAVTYSFEAYGPGLTVNGNSSSLSDRELATGVNLHAPFTDSNGSYVHAFTVNMTQTGWHLPDGLLIRASEAQPSRITVALQDAGTLVYSLNVAVGGMHSSGVLLFPDAVRDEVSSFRGDTLSIFVQFQVPNLDLTVQTCCPVFLGSNVIGSARAEAKLPVPAAASALVPGWVDPQPTVQIQRRGPNNEDLGIVTLPGALFKYGVGGLIDPASSSAVSLQTTVQLGQPDTPDALGEAALIKGRDRRATLIAVSVAT